MKNRIIRILFASALSFTAVSAFAGVSVSNHICEQPIKVEAGESSYYSSISDSLTGTELLNALHTLNSQKRTRTVGYNGMKTFAAKCDVDPDGSGKIIGFYDNKKVGPSWDSAATWNREHVWPNVRDGDKVENDAHMVRPAATSTNSDRGSKGFGTESYDPGQFVEYYRGAAARIIFYAAIADTSLQVVDFPFDYNGVGSGNSGYPVGSMGSLSDMLKWNLQYLPTDTSFTGENDLARRTELNRNEVIQNDSSGQGNRNPFIDHPEYACKIWGNANAKTKAICGGQAPVDPDPEGPSISISVTEKTLQIGNTFELIATTSNSSQVSWSTDDSNFEVIQISPWTTASGSPLRVKAVGEGTANITATSGQNKVTCVITVVKELPPQQNEELTNNKNNKALYLGLGIGLGFLLIAGVVVLIVVLTRKKKVA